MGFKQHSRKKLAPGATCYLCGKAIVKGQSWNRDHVPPQRIFASSVLQRFSTQLTWLPTHAECNTAFADDEDYFVTALAGHHDTPWARAVIDDIRRGVSKGKGIGLIKTILSQFGKVIGPDGSRMFALDANRANRAVWKIVRGVYTLETDKFLPIDSHLHIDIIPRSEVEQALQNHVWFRYVRNTDPMGKHKAIFDVKWVCRHEGAYRVNLMALLLWDNLTLLSLFHDPSCQCELCTTDPPAQVGN
jgi:hypothetical protein